MSARYGSNEGNKLNFEQKFTFGTDTTPWWFDKVRGSTIYECTARKDMDNYLKSNDYTEAINKLKIVVELEK